MFFVTIALPFFSKDSMMMYKLRPKAVKSPFGRTYTSRKGNKLTLVTRKIS